MLLLNNPCWASTQSLADAGNTLVHRRLLADYLKQCTERNSQNACVLKYELSLRTLCYVRDKSAKESSLSQLEDRYG